MSIQNFDETTIKNIINEHELVLIDFWATWCGPCKQFGPIFEDVSDMPEYAQAYFTKVDIDIHEDYTLDAGISSVPTLFIFKDGNLVYNKPGALDKVSLVELINSL
ncbi:MAG: thioredoxin fold domain-containing protein [Bifidobacteriaceae bacterium]|jgi:thioredoxin 1|nr:thioredoxin fold domain-containing protein [Bifidobacteriaceae bacterium]